MTDMITDYKLDRYIENEFKEISENNACEHRPTYKREFDAAEKYIRELYERGEKLIAGISTEDLSRCAKMYKLKHAYGSHELVKVMLSKTWVIVPHYVTVLEEMKRMREAVL